jgi:V8-like Glu-specific endopeptidase
VAFLAQVILGVVGTSVSTPTSAKAMSVPIPVSVHMPGLARVGALFTRGTARQHGCTGSVVHSPSHDTVLIAAHCGVTAGMFFAPGYDDGATPYGVWRVSGVFVDTDWAAHSDARHDYAILKMARQVRAGRWQGIEDVTGAYALGTAPRAGTQLVVIGYPVGIYDRPIKCPVTVYLTGAYPAMDCHGYVGGTSGSPWIAYARGRAATVVGVIGGLQHGGRYEYTSYTSPFGPAVATLLATASAAPVSTAGRAKFLLAS